MSLSQYIIFVDTLQDKFHNKHELDPRPLSTNQDNQTPPKITFINEAIYPKLAFIYKAIIYMC